MAKILLLTPEFPYPPRQGASIRNLNIIRGLSKNHDVGLLSLTTFSEIPSATSLKELCASIEIVRAHRRTARERAFGFLRSRDPDLARRLRSEEYARKLAEQLSRRGSRVGTTGPYDIVQIEGLELAFCIPVIKKTSPSSYIIYDAHNAESELQRRSLKIDLGQLSRWPAAFYSFLQLRRLKRYEKWACREVDWVVAVSEADKQNLEGMTGAPRISVIANSIDIESFGYGVDGDTRESDVLFVGKMDYRPNVDAVLWFAREIWPSIRRIHEQATWTIVGQQPHRRIETLRDVPGVKITGMVPSVLPYLFGAKVFIAPFRIGSGSRLKIIEAMAARRAIVATSVGVEGFPAKGGHHLEIANSSESFARSVNELLDNPRQRRDLGENARTLAENYDWRTVIPGFEKIYERLLQNRDSQ